jgi:thiol-disulfide isomerase/thioredoxin
MVALVTAVVVVGLLGVLNLVFCFGVIRRLREHTKLLENRHGGPAPTLIRPAGQVIDEFAATTVDGTEISRESLSGTTLAAFFSPGCGPCAEQLPAFVELARAHPGGRDRVLAVLTHDDEDGAADMAAALADVAEVVHERPGTGAVKGAFEVRGFPVFALVAPGGLLLVSELSVDGLTAPAPV